jgi:hypothetical protein
MKFEEAPRLTQRLQFIEEAKRQFWKKWMQQLFSGRMLSHKWTKNVRNVAVGDIIYLAEAENDDPTYRLGQIVEACPGEDGCVRTVRVQYTSPGKPEGKRSPPKTTTRLIHKVAMVVPVEYVFEDDTCDNEVGSRGPKRDLRTKEEIEAAKASRRTPPRRRRGSLRQVERSPRSARDAGDPRSWRGRQQPRTSLKWKSGTMRVQQRMLRHLWRLGTSPLP